MLCGQLNAKELVYVCSTCKPTDDEDGDDEELQAQLLKHDQRRLELLARKDQIIKEERERLAATKKKQDDMIARIKAVFADDDPIEQESKDDIMYIGSREAGARVQIVNRLTGDCVPVQAPPPPVPFRLLSSSTTSCRSNTAIGFLPRRQMEEKVSSSSEEEDEELNRVLKISAIFSGDDVCKLDAFLPKNCIAETPPPSKGIAQTPPPSTGIAQTPPPSIRIAQTPPPSIGIAQTPPPSIRIAETHPPLIGIAETHPPSKAETEGQKRHQNLTTTESYIHSSNEDTGLSASDTASAAEEDRMITEEKVEGKETSVKPMIEEQSDDDLEEILADEFIDQDSPDMGMS